MPGMAAAGKGYLFALGAAALWAASATLAKALFQADLDPLWLAQTRSLTAFLLLWPVLFLFRRPLALPPRRHLPHLARVGLHFTLLHGTYYFAISRMPVAVAILVQDLAPLLILAWVGGVRRQPVGRGLWGAALLCLVGCALVVGLRGNAGGIGGIGLLVGLVSAVAYASYILLAEHGGRLLSPWMQLCGGLGFSALIWGIFRPWWRFPFEALTPSVVGLILVLGFCGTLLPFAFLSLSLRHIASGPAGIATTAEPVIAAGLAYLFLGERLAPPQLVGGALVLAGILLAQRVSRPDAPQRADENAVPEPTGATARRR